MKAQPNNFPHFKAKLMRVQCSAAPLFPSLLALLFLQLSLIPFVARSDVP